MHTFDICIDESGDEGFNFENSDTTRWFVLAGAVVIRHNMDTLQSSLRELKASIGWKDKKPLHFRDLKPPNRERMVNQLVQVGPHVFRGLAILVHKPSLLEPEIFQQKSRGYFSYPCYP